MRDDSDVDSPGEFKCEPRVRLVVSHGTYMYICTYIPPAEDFIYDSIFPVYKTASRENELEFKLSKSKTAWMKGRLENFEVTDSGPILAHVSHGAPGHTGNRTLTYLPS